jgi:hypothetical protein
VTDRPFAHASEEELARILDYYQVRWEYEPRTFPILWNLDGKVVESFAPDFYLPELDMYVELTTLKQSLVRKKNRKLRRLRELYPDLRIKLFYAKDFKALMLKYGRIDLAASLSGIEGQARRAAADDEDKTIDRPAVVVGTAVLVAAANPSTPAAGGGDVPASDDVPADDRASDQPSPCLRPGRDKAPTPGRRPRRLRRAARRRAAADRGTH